MTFLAIVLNLKLFPRVHVKLQHLEVREFTTTMFISNNLREKLYDVFCSMCQANCW